MKRSRLKEIIKEGKTIDSVQATIKKSKLREIIREVIADTKNDQLQDYEYLLHHIEVNGGVEIIHHCKLYDHIGNL